MDVLEHHPYTPFIPRGAKKMIIGNFPIGKFSNHGRLHEIKENDIVFYYGGATNRLWPLIGSCFDLELNSKKKIQDFLSIHGIGVADILQSCRRRGGSALDSALYDKTYNPNLAELIEEKGIRELIFTSKHVYQEFRKHIGKFPGLIHTVLISPSPNAVRGLVKNREYLKLKEKNSDLSVVEFRAIRYREVFCAG